MPCNFRAELISAVNSNPKLKAVQLKYSTLINQIILKMANSPHKFNSDEYIDEYLEASKMMVAEFTTHEKLLLALIEIDPEQLINKLQNCQEINYILTTNIDDMFLS